MVAYSALLTTLYIILHIHRGILISYIDFHHGGVHSFYVEKVCTIDHLDVKQYRPFIPSFKIVDASNLRCAGGGVCPWKGNYSKPPAVSFCCLMLVCLHCAVYIFKHHCYKELFSGFTAINRLIKQIWWVYIIFLTCTSHLTCKLSRSKLHIMFVPVLSNFSQLYQMSFHIQYIFGNLYRVISR